MYTLLPQDLITNAPKTVQRSLDRASIPFDSNNTDYQQFVRDIKSGAQLNDAEGNPITGAALTTFIGTLP
jgi:hypothetical protein